MKLDIFEIPRLGLNWETILKKRENYRKLFYNFDVDKVASMTNRQLDKLLDNPGIIRNKLKIYSTRKNAKIFIEIQKEFGSFAKYLWGFVGGKPIINHWGSFNNTPTQTKESIDLSKNLKKRSMSFVGPTIIYAYMQSVGMVNDHLTTCWKYDK